MPPSTSTQHTKKAKPKKKLADNLMWRGKVIWMTYTVGGKQYKESCQTDDPQRAVGLLRQKQAAIFDGTFTPNKGKHKLTVAGLCDLWLERPKTLEKASYKDDVQRFKTILELLGADKPVHTLTHRDCEQLQASLKRRTVGKKLKKPISPTTVNRHLVLLKSALTYCRIHGHNHQDPMAGIHLDTEHPKKRFCTDEEFQAMTSHESVTPELILLLQVGYYTGMRLRSCVELTWDRVNLQKGFIVLRPQDIKTNNYLEVPIDEELLPILKAARESQKVPELHGRLFDMKVGRASQVVGELSKKLGTDVTFHAFRGTLVTTLLEAGQDGISVASITGHKSLQTVMGYSNIRINAKHNVLKARRGQTSGDTGTGQ